MPIEAIQFHWDSKIIQSIKILLHLLESCSNSGIPLDLVGAKAKRKITPCLHLTADT